MLLRYGTRTPRNIYKLDMIQRYHNISSVTEMVGHLGWEPVATRRRNMRVCIMYKIAHTVVGDPWAEWLTTTKRVTRVVFFLYFYRNFYILQLATTKIVEAAAHTPPRNSA